MNRAQTIVVEARLQGKTIEEAAALAGLKYSYVAKLVAGMKGQVKNEIIKRTRQSERKLRKDTDITRADILANFQEIYAQAMTLTEVKDNKGRVVDYRANLSAACKAQENIGRIIGVYAEDNKQRGSGSLGEALADLIRTRTALQAASQRQAQLTGSAESEDTLMTGKHGGIDVIDQCSGPIDSDNEKETPVLAEFSEKAEAKGKSETQNIIEGAP